MARILVIDDEPQIRRMIHRALASLHHSVFEAQDGEEGLEVLERERPAVVITDILMPNREGIETITAIRRTSAAVKIIAISGGTFYLSAAKKLGADAVLSKPFRAEDLIDTVDRLLASL